MTLTDKQTHAKWGEGEHFTSTGLFSSSMRSSLSTEWPHDFIDLNLSDKKQLKLKERG